MQFTILCYLPTFQQKTRKKKTYSSYCKYNLLHLTTEFNIIPFFCRLLQSRNVVPREFNSYGSRRGNDAIMARGTFANIRLVNKLNGGGKAGPKTLHLPSNEIMDIFDAAERYREVSILILFPGPIRTDNADESHKYGSPRSPEIRQHSALLI